MSPQDAKELRRRVDQWVERGGREQLERNLKLSEEARAEIRDAFRVDHETLSQPMTI